MYKEECEEKLRNLVIHAWDDEIKWPQIEQWAENFIGTAFDQERERDHGLFALTRFMYFGRRLVRELLRSLYRDHFEAPLMQRIRRNYGSETSGAVLRSAYSSELASTRFIGVGNPAESGAHLLYFFRQVNHLSKELFSDIHEAFVVRLDESGRERYEQRNGGVSRYVFFDDLVGSGDQVSQYLKTSLRAIRQGTPEVELRFLSLFATSAGIDRLNEKQLFDGKAFCLFELDDSYKAFDANSRYFSGAPEWFVLNDLQQLARVYGSALQPRRALGYKDGQLLLGFSHNTPDNTLPIFWDEGIRHPWSPVFQRYDKK
ncbi:hypothetical protein CLU95_3819 [Variovorax sp. 54]|uniref:phosphoribosyltransferase-like protein n=1 Tax=Variovorax sp. 54 TaxID=2035212 RepID=UPI000C190B5D|nr:hypothetical protein [Variovorax sp. 54]PIF76651.1 hypothetical protein CLU95_3819 [Variovorax sp. 54]